MLNHRPEIKDFSIEINRLLADFSVRMARVEDLIETVGELWQEKEPCDPLDAQ